MTNNEPIVPSDFKAIADEIESLLKIDTDNLDAEALRGTMIFVRLHRLYNIEGKKLRHFTQLLDKLEMIRWKHYNGLLDGKHYREDPLPVKPNKTDVNLYMKSDSTLQEMREIVRVQDSIVSFIEDSIKQAKNRNFDIKNAIDFRKMLTS